MTDIGGLLLLALCAAGCLWLAGLLDAAEKADIVRIGDERLRKERHAKR